MADRAQQKSTGGWKLCSGATVSIHGLRWTARRWPPRHGEQAALDEIAQMLLELLDERPEAAALLAAAPSRARCTERFYSGQ